MWDAETVTSARRHVSGESRRWHVLEADNVTMQFGGLKALSRHRLPHRRGRDRRAHRPERRRQDDVLQPAHRHLQADRGHADVRRQEPRAAEAAQICKMGIARTFQNIRLFANMTTLENVMVGRHSRIEGGRRCQAVLRTPGVQARGEAQVGRRRSKRLRFVGLGRQGERAGEEPALRRPAPPRDRARARDRAEAPPARRAGRRHEPAGERRAHASSSRKIRETGVTVLLIEHDMKVVMGIADRICVLDFGEKIAEGRRPRSSATRRSSRRTSARAPKP